MTTSEKVAYLKGLMEGMELDKDSKEGKLFLAIADILEDLALDIEDLEENSLDLAEEIDAISDDLADVEDLIFDDDDFDDDDFDDDDCDCGCGCGCCEDDDEEPMFFEVTCPACENTITVDEDVLDLGAIQCPNCGEMLEFEFDEDDEEDEE
ncbi:MAG: hypothetical protein IKZ30_00140 [Oscillospiraceae bacterium]|nr:hypothetical protein [Oscillospiraceae bacterium]